MVEKEQKRFEVSFEAEVPKLDLLLISREGINQRLIHGGCHARRPSSNPKPTTHHK